MSWHALWRMNHVTDQAGTSVTEILCTQLHSLSTRVYSCHTGL